MADNYMDALIAAGKKLLPIIVWLVFILRSLKSGQVILTGISDPKTLPTGRGKEYGGSVVHAHTNGRQLSQTEPERKVDAPIVIVDDDPVDKYLINPQLLLRRPSRRQLSWRKDNVDDRFGPRADVPSARHPCPLSNTRQT